MRTNLLGSLVLAALVSTTTSALAQEAPAPEASAEEARGLSLEVAVLGGVNLYLDEYPGVEIIGGTPFGGFSSPGLRFSLWFNPQVYVQAAASTVFLGSVGNGNGFIEGTGSLGQLNLGVGMSPLAGRSPVEPFLAAAGGMTWVRDGDFDLDKLPWFGGEVGVRIPVGEQVSLRAQLGLRKGTEEEGLTLEPAVGASVFF